MYAKVSTRFILLIIAVVLFIVCAVGDYVYRAPAGAPPTWPWSGRMFCIAMAFFAASFAF